MPERKANTQPLHHRACCQRNIICIRKGCWEIRSMKLNDRAKQYWFYYLLPILEILGIQILAVPLGIGR